MTKDKTVTISRELADHLASPYTGLRNQAMYMLRAVLAQEAGKCVTCGGSGIVDDGELTHSSGGIPFEMGPIKCVKDCPDCTSPPAPVSVPDGWKLVPIEPTELMIRRGDQNYSWSVAKIYKAMIDDAPACLDKVKELNQ